MDILTVEGISGAFRFTELPNALIEVLSALAQYKFTRLFHMPMYPMHSPHELREIRVHVHCTQAIPISGWCR